MKVTEIKARLETIYWVCNIALISYNRYKSIVGDSESFSLIFPGVDSTNPKIRHTILGSQGESIVNDFVTSKNEVMARENHDLYKAYQIVLGIVAMTAILDQHLKDKAEEITGKRQNILGIFERFSRETNIRLSNFQGFSELQKYRAIRDISIHNLGRKNEHFYRKTGSPTSNSEAFVYYPQQLSFYKVLLEQLIDYIEQAGVSLVPSE